MTNIPYDNMSTISKSDGLFTKCCCCIPLRVGCFILGYLNLVLNVFHLVTIGVMTVLLGIVTHGFDHFDQNRNQPVSDDILTMEKPVLNKVGLVLIMVMCANFTWMLVNVACLVGLHKKRPGPIRMYIGFATARLLLAMAGFVYMSTSTETETHRIISCSIDLGLTAYFILVYYLYAGQLERETIAARAVIHIQPQIYDNAFIYPKKLEKEILVA